MNVLNKISKHDLQAICVDLDGTLVWQDCFFQFPLFDSFQHLHKNPQTPKCDTLKNDFLFYCAEKKMRPFEEISIKNKIFIFLFKVRRLMTMVRKAEKIWGLRKIAHIFYQFGWAGLKTLLGQQIKVAPHLLLYHTSLLKWLTLQHEKGIPLYLVTGADQRVANSIGKHLGIFKECWGTTQNNHLVGPRKAAWLIKKFPLNAFMYIGDSWKDMKVWEASAKVGIVWGKEAPLSRALLRKYPKKEITFFPWPATLLYQADPLQKEEK